MRILNFFFKIFRLVLNFPASFFHKESVPPNSRTRPRKLPLHTFAVSILSSAHRAYTRAQGLNGTLLRKPAWFVISAEQYGREFKNRILTILTMADDRILATEAVIEKYFPVSTVAFDKLDDLVRATEIFPDKAEKIVAKLPGIVPDVPILNRSLSYICSWFGSLVSKPGLEISTREKDIPIDLGSSASYRKIETNKSGESCLMISPRGTYKEVLMEHEKANHRDDNRKPPPSISDDVSMNNKVDISTKTNNNNNNNNNNKKKKKVEGDEAEVEKLTVDEDPILDLFETGWHMNNIKPVKRAKSAGTMVRAASCIN